jgi:acetyltransferase-like isoleucine patch superfamily enzyme
MTSHVIQSNQYMVRLRASPKLWEIFETHRISFGRRKPEQVKTIEIDKSAAIEPYCDWMSGNRLHGMGSFSYTQSDLIDAHMGRYCSVAIRARTSGARHPIEHVTTTAFLNVIKPSFQWARDELLGGRSDMVRMTVHTKPLPVLEHDVWIGEGAWLGRGITVRTGSVVAAGAVVTKDVPPYAIVGGNPAKIIRYRFEPKLIERLLASRWWELHPRILFDLDVRKPPEWIEKVEARRAELETFQPRAITWREILRDLGEPD